jgi:hypothetical protein
MTWPQTPSCSLTTNGWVRPVRAKKPPPALQLPGDAHEMEKISPSAYGPRRPGPREDSRSAPGAVSLVSSQRAAEQRPALVGPADGTVARRCARHRADCQVCAPAARPRPAARAARRPASPAATGARGRSAARCRSRAPTAVPPEFRPACGHPGAHVTVRQVPVTVRHAACDLTGVALSYPGHGGATIPRTPSGVGNSKGFRLSVDPCTLDVTIEVTGSPAGPRQSR